MCPTDAITLQRRGGAYAVVWNSDLCTECGLCERVCPSNEVDIGQMQRLIWRLEPESLFVGPVLQSGYGRALTDELFNNGQSGGLLSAVVASLLAQQAIDGAVVVGLSAGDPLLPEPFVATKASELPQSQGSKYVPVPTAAMIKQVAKSQGRVAFVGLPCQILALRKAESILPRLKNKIYLHLGLFCAGMWTFGLLDHLLKVAGVKSGQVKRFRYRGHAWRGWPGDTEIELTDGKLEFVDRLHRQIVRELYLPLRCFYCHDKLNTLADISFGDPWGLDFEGHTQRATAFLIRSREGLEAMDRAVTSGFVDRWTVKDDLIARGQKSKEYESDFISRLEAARRLGRIPPLYSHSLVTCIAPGRKTPASTAFDVVWQHFSSKDKAQRLWRMSPVPVAELLCRCVRLSRGLFRRIG